LGLARGLVLDVANQLGGASPSTATLKDWSRHGNDGTITDVTWTQLPSGLWVMNFDGTNDYVTISHALSLANDYVSAEAWVRVDGGAGLDRAIMHKGCTSGAAGDWQLVVDSNDKFHFYAKATGVWSINLPATDVYTAGVWYYLCATYGSDNTARLYIDGVLDDTDATGTGAIVKGTVDANIGVVQNLAFDFTGIIALARIYNYVRTPAQIRACYHNTRWMFEVP
tara:strand:- start:13999 stop:14673 length:675 start_codon:yes stop_codon:yes gene_type:complete